MSVLALIISLVALVLAIKAYQRAGGEAELKKRVEGLSSALDSLREKTADLLSKAEAALRKKEEGKEGSEF